jgi:hypothetical protein
MGKVELSAEWLLDLWQAAPTPQKTSRLHETTITKLLKRHRIRRLAAATVMLVVRQPPESW